MIIIFKISSICTPLIKNLHSCCFLQNFHIMSQLQHRTITSSSYFHFLSHTGTSVDIHYFCSWYYQYSPFNCYMRLSVYYLNVLCFIYRLLHIQTQVSPFPKLVHFFDIPNHFYLKLKINLCLPIQD